MFQVRVPASTANLGSGFDCMGIALKLYNTAEFDETDKEFEVIIKDDSSAYIPKDDNNLVIKSMKLLYKKANRKFDGVKISSYSDIPVTRGLGSSSAGIILGLVGANHILGDKFSKSELLQTAYEIEGHPDNVTPALLGGFTVSVFDRGKIVYSKSEVSSNLRFAAMIPDFYLATRKSRSVLPRYVSLRNASYNIAHASLLACAMSKSDSSLLASCFKDKLHQRCRFPYIRSGEYIIRCAKRFGACGGYISGAGPTIMSIIDKDCKEFEYNMNKLIKNNLRNWRLVMLEADNSGAVIE